MGQFSQAITQRYDRLSEQECCLSCGKALSFATVKPGDVCIDLGSGRGHDLLRMAIMAGEKGFVYGIDISDGMIEQAKKNAGRLHLRNIELVNSPLERIPLHDHLADVVISNCTINHSRDQAAVWGEIARILKPGGCFVVSDIYALEQVPPEYASNPSAVAECWAGAITRELYMQNILNAGLVEIELLEESVPYEKGEIKVASFTVAGKKPVNGRFSSA